VLGLKVVILETALPIHLFGHLCCRMYRLIGHNAHRRRHTDDDANSRLYCLQQFRLERHSMHFGHSLSPNLVHSMTALHSVGIHAAVVNANIQNTQFGSAR